MFVMDVDVDSLILNNNKSIHQLCEVMLSILWDTFDNYMEYISLSWSD